jgi:hypothetical protein
MSFINLPTSSGDCRAALIVAAASSIDTDVFLPRSHRSKVPILEDFRLARTAKDPE